MDYAGLRAKALYRADEKEVHRISCDNKSVKKLYKEFLGEPNGEKRINYYIRTIISKKHMKGMNKK